MSEHVWVNLFYEGKEESQGGPFPVEVAKIAFGGIIAGLQAAVKERRTVALSHCDAPDLKVYNPGTDVNELTEANSLNPDITVPTGAAATSTIQEPWIVVAPTRQLAQSAAASTGIPVELLSVAQLTAESLHKRDDVSDYIAAAMACRGQEDVELIFQQVMELQDNIDYDQLPSPFVCILESSGCGKTQLAATAAIVKPTFRVFYFYTGEVFAENLQPFYRPHEELWRVLPPLLEDLQKLTRDTQKSIHKHPGADRILGFVGAHQVFEYFSKILFGTDEYNTARALRLQTKAKLTDKTFVFIDEVPPQATGKFDEAIMLRDCCRAIGLVPILMSTHSGAQNAVPCGGNSRQGDGPDLWCRLITELPANHSFESNGYAFPSDRPLVYNILSKLDANQQKDLDACVRAVRDNLQKTKPGAWKKSSSFQLCQLFRSLEHEEQPMSCTHRLVGQHFGHLTIEHHDIKREGVAKLLQDGRVRMPAANTEPMLCLALTAWWVSEVKGVDGGFSKFPLVNSSGEAISVRKAYAENESLFTSNIDTGNPAAPKLSGDCLQVVSLASMTLASLRCDDGGVLAGVPLTRFIATVCCLMKSQKLTAEILMEQEEKINEMVATLELKKKEVNGAVSFLKVSDVKVPACPSADSLIPEDFLSQSTNDRFRKGHLKRPRDSEQNDDSIAEQGNKLYQIECKNYKDGVGTDCVESIFARFTVDCPIYFIFTSEVNGVWRDDHRLQDVLPVDGKIAFLLLSPDTDPSWLKTAAGRELSPTDDTACFVVNFAIAPFIKRQR